MKRSKRSPYERLATDADKLAWTRVFAYTALVGFIQVTEANMTHWAAIVRREGLYKKHLLHRLCDYYVFSKPGPNIEVNCMTCIVRIERGPGARR